MRQAGPLRTVTLPSPLAARYAAFVEWARTATLPDSSRTEYWQETGALASVRVEGSRVDVLNADASLLLPISATRRRLTKALRDPMAALRAVGRRFERATPPILLSYEAAFDAVVTAAPVADMDISPARFDHRAAAARPGAYPDRNALRTQMRLARRYPVSAQLIQAAYLANVLNATRNGDPTPGHVLEIGSGGGVLASVLRDDLGARLTLVDLPETLVIAALLLAETFPDATFRFPHERADPNAPADITLLAPSQLDQVASDSVDLAINVNSFQEMTPDEVARYFALVQSAVRDGGSLLVRNRIEKIAAAPSDWRAGRPTREAVMRFAEYPWCPGNDVLVYEVCRLNRLVQLDGAFLRVERVRKGQG